MNELKIIDRLERIEQSLDRLDRLEQIEQTLDRLVREQATKEWYTTAEVAEIIGKSDYTVREYCRKGQITAKKAPNGRGWLVSHEELERLRNHGPQPEPKYRAADL